MRGRQYGLAGVAGLKGQQKLEEKQTVFHLTGAVEKLAATTPTCAYARCSVLSSKTQTCINNSLVLLQDTNNNFL